MASSAQQNALLALFGNKGVFTSSPTKGVSGGTTAPTRARPVPTTTYQAPPPPRYVPPPPIRAPSPAVTKMVAQLRTPPKQAPAGTIARPVGKPLDLGNFLKAPDPWHDNYSGEPLRQPKQVPVPAPGWHAPLVPHNVWVTERPNYLTPQGLPHSWTTDPAKVNLLKALKGAQLPEDARRVLNAPGAPKLTPAVIDYVRHQHQLTAKPWGFSVNRGIGRLNKAYDVVVGGMAHSFIAGVAGQNDPGWLGTGGKRTGSGYGAIPGMPSPEAFPTTQAAIFSAKTARNAGKDYVNMVATTPTAAWDTGANLYAGIGKGDWKPLKQEGAGLVSQVLHPAEHPLGALMMLHGGLAAGGALAGIGGDMAAAGRAALRAGGGDAGKVAAHATMVARVAARNRPDIHLGANLYIPQRPFSRNPYMRMWQKSGDLRGWKTGLPEGEHGKIDLPEKTPIGGVKRAVRRVVAENTDMGENIRRNDRHEIGTFLHDAIKATRAQGKTWRDVAKQAGRYALNPSESIFRPDVHGRESIGILGQLGITKAEQVRPALTRYLEAIKNHRELHPEENDALKQVQQDTIDRIQSALTDNKFMENPQPAIDAARAIQAYQAEFHTPELVRLEQFGADSALAAKLVPYATSDMGLERGPFQATVKRAQKELDLAALRNDRVSKSHAAAIREASQQLHDAVTKEDSLRNFRTGPEAQAYRGAQLATSAAYDNLEAVMRTGDFAHHTGVDEVLRTGMHEGSAIPHIQDAIQHLGPNGDPAKLAELRRQLELQKKIEAPPRRGTPLKEGDHVFYDPHTGRVVPEQEIINHMSAHERADPLFISHRPQISDTKSAMYIPSTRHPLAHNDLRTGEAWRRGLTDSSFQALTNQLQSERGKINASLMHEHHLQAGAIFNTHGVSGGPEGYWENFGDAQRAIDSPAVKKQNPHNLKLVPVAIHQLFTRKGQIGQIKGDLTPVHQGMSSEPWRDATNGDQGPGRYVLMPEEYVNTLKGFEGQRTRGGNVLRTTTVNFRRAALALSIHRIIGLPMENWLFRGIPAKAIPGDPMWGRLKTELSKPEYQTEEFQRAVGQNGRLGPTGKQWVKMAEARAFTGQQSAQALRLRTANPLGRGAALPGEAANPLERLQGAARQGAVPVWNHWTNLADGILRGERRYLEHPFQHALASRWLREMNIDGVSFGDALKLQGEAMREFAQGIVGGHHEVAFARYIDRAGGRYGKLSPWGQKAMLATPFGLWWFNSLKFVYGTMPADHPIVTGMLAAANTGTEKQRAEQGLLGPFLNSDERQLVSQQQGSIPFAKGKTEQAQYYSPYGIVSGPIETLTSMFDPQLQTVINAGQGNNWYGGKLTVPGLGRGAEVPDDIKAKVALNAFLDSITPLEKIQQLLAGGRAQYGSNTIFDQLTGRGRYYPDAGAFGFRPFAEGGLLNPFKVQKNRLASGSTATSRAVRPNLGPPIPGSGSSGVGPPIPGAGSSGGVGPPIP
jgi:hypothetical protein